MAGEMDKTRKQSAGQMQQAESEDNQQEPQQDKLDELLADVPEWLRGPLKLYYRQILVSIALVIVVASLWSGYSYYVNRQEAAASFQLGIAMSSNNMDSKISELKSIQDRFSRTSAARLAGLLIGQVYLQKGEWDNALEAFKKAEGDFEGIMADTAAMGQGYSLEEKRQLEGALSRRMDAIFPWWSGDGVGVRVGARL